MNRDELPDREELEAALDAYSATAVDFTEFGMWLHQYVGSDELIRSRLFDVMMRARDRQKLWLDKYDCRPLEERECVGPIQ